MVYNVRADSIARDIGNEVRDSILNFLKTYEFPYVTTVSNKTALRKLFINHFTNKTTLPSLVTAVYSIAASPNLRGVAAVAWTETNRLHTAGLGKILLSKDQTQCTTVHSYGSEPMNDVCKINLEGKVLNIKEILNYSFPATRNELKRTDIPMIPQHINCRHVMAPLESKDKTYE